MKSDIHPQYYSDSKMKCACGNSWTTGATVESLSLEICDQCHPFYTGKDKRVDTRGRIDKFSKRAEKSQAKIASISAKKSRTKKQEDK